MPTRHSTTKTVNRAETMQIYNADIKAYILVQFHQVASARSPHAVAVLSIHV